MQGYDFLFRNIIHEHSSLLKNAFDKSAIGYEEFHET